MATKIKKIGHASMSENNSKYGEVGDSTGKEVCTVNNYDISRIKPYIVLRPKTALLAEASAIACEAGCLNDNIGYSQSNRNTLYNRAKELDSDLTKVDLLNIITKCNTDCSAFMSVCAIVGGANLIYGSNGPTTSTMRAKFKQSGDYEVLTSTEYTNSADLLKRGDILVKEGYHTIMVLKNGTEIPDDPDEPGDEPTVEDEEPYVPIEQVVTPVTSTTWTDRQFNYSATSTKKVYIKVNNDYKQAAVYLSNNPVILHLNRKN
jgi:hypothetical protein